MTVSTRGIIYSKSFKVTQYRRLSKVLRIRYNKEITYTSKEDIFFFFFFFILSSPLIVFRFSWWHLSLASDVIKLMNSLTHSGTHSLASFVIFPVCGMAFFIILATFAVGRYISCSLKLSFEPFVSSWSFRGYILYPHLLCPYLDLFGSLKIF